MDDFEVVALEDEPVFVKPPKDPRPSALPPGDGVMPLLLQVKEELREVLREEHKLLRDWTTSWGRGQQRQMEEYTQSLLRQIEKKDKEGEGKNGCRSDEDCGTSGLDRAWDSVVPIIGGSRLLPGRSTSFGPGIVRSTAPASTTLVVPTAVVPMATPTSPPERDSRSTHGGDPHCPNGDHPRHPFEVRTPATEKPSPFQSEDEESNWEAISHCDSRIPCVGVICDPCASQESHRSHRNSAISDDVSKEIDREEWAAHLRRRVSQQLTQKAFVGVRSGVAGGRESSRVAKIVEHSAFQFVCASVIVVNAVFAGYTSDVSMSTAMAVPPQEDPEWFKTCNSAFTAWFCIEITIRIVASGKSFFLGPDWRWNALDSVLALSSVVEEVFQDVGLGSLRVIRGLRMFRVLRIIRVMRFFRDLRLMVCSVMQSLASLSWALLLLIIIMYLFTVFFMQGAIIHFREDAGSQMVRQGIDLYYSTVFDTMYTLLGAITGGLNWVDVVRPLEEISFIYRCLFAFYVVFVVVGVLNVLTGIFVERANELSGLDKDLVIQSEMKRNETFLAEMKRIFEEADADGSGTISWDEFKGYLKNDRVKAYLATQQLDAFDARTLFDILNVGEGGEIGIDQFIVGCMRLKGMAKSVDLVAVLQETRAVGRRIKALARQLEHREKTLQRMSSSISQMGGRRMSLRAYTTGTFDPAGMGRSSTTGALV